MIYTPKVCDLKSGNVNYKLNFNTRFPETHYTFPIVKFTPEKGQAYYYPVLDNEHGYGTSRWMCSGSIGHNRELKMLRDGLIFENIMGAVTARDIMIDSLKSK